MDNPAKTSTFRSPVRPELRHWLGLSAGLAGLVIGMLHWDGPSYLRIMGVTGFVVVGATWRISFRRGGHHLLWLLPACLIASQAHFLLAGGMPHHRSFSDALIHGIVIGVFFVMMAWLTIRSTRRIYPWLSRKAIAWRRLLRCRRQPKLATVPAGACGNALADVDLRRIVGSDDALVVFVHGTYARNAPWTTSGSIMYAGLKRALGESARVSAFQWSGENSHEDRIRAGNELATYVRQVVLAAKERKVLLIAHSQGGNVALYALKQQPALGELVAGIVTMATPFLSIRRRNVHEGVGLMTWIAPLVLWTTALVVFVPIAIVFQQWWLVGIMVVLLLGFPIVALKRLQGWIRGPLARRLIERQKQISERMDPTPAVRVPLLYAYVTYDEAGLFLRMLHVVGGGGHHLLSFLRRLIRIGLLTTVALLFVTMAIDGEFEGRTDVGEIVAGDGITALFLASLLYCLSLLIAAAWPFLVRGHKFGFGSESLLTNFLVDIGASHAPQSALAGTPCSIKVRQGSGLRHSFLYTSPEFLDKLAAWLSGTAADLTRPPQRAPRPGWLPLEAALAGFAVLALAMSTLPKLEHDLRRAASPTYFDLRYPDLLPQVRHRSMVLRGQFESSLGRPLVRTLVVQSDACRLTGYVRSKENLAVKLLHGDHAHDAADGGRFSVVDMHLRGEKPFTLQILALTILPKQFEAELELVCGVDEPRWRIDWRDPGASDTAAALIGR